MTSSRILFPQFRDEQSSSKYPFADSATLLSDNGIKIDNDLFTDASFFGVGVNERVYISSIVVTAQTVTITVGDAANSTRMTGSYSVFNPPETGVIAFTDLYGRPAGTLLIGKNECDRIKFSTWPIGQHSFKITATEFVSTVVIPAKEPGVRAITPEPQQLQTGDVWLVGNNGVVVRAEDDRTIRVDIIGAPLFKRLICEPQTTFVAKPVLRTINGCGPDSYGNFIITATNKTVNHPTTRIYPNNDTLTIATIGS